MQQIVGRVSCMVLFALYAWTRYPVSTDGQVDPDESDGTFDWSDDGPDDRTSDWSIEEDDENDDDNNDDDVRSAAAAVLQQVDDDVYAGKMMAFFAKLNSLRRKRREDRQSKPESSSSSGLEELSSLPSLPPPPPSTNTDRDRKSGFRPGEGDDDDDDRSHSETEDHVASPQPRPARGDLVQTRPDDRYVLTAAMARRRGRRGRDDGGSHRRSRLAGYLHMGWNSARCVWRQYRDADDGPRRQWTREWLEDAARFWAVAVGLSVAALWAVFGSFHEPFGAVLVAAPSPDGSYARDVNRYLNTVPPHAVVTGRGKMFRYRPTAEERFLWKSAKKIAGFRV